MQPGSSIMPGKVNPVVCESVIMVACQVVALDHGIALGGFGGVGSLLELNVAMPLVAVNLLDTVRLLTNASAMFVDRCIDGLELRADVASGMVERSLMLATLLVPELGYDRAAAVAKAAFAAGTTIRAQVLAEGLCDERRLDELLDPRGMTEPLGDAAAPPG
jgi:fumarate hydratase class II